VLYHQQQHGFYLGILCCFNNITFFIGKVKRFFKPPTMNQRWLFIWFGMMEQQYKSYAIRNVITLFGDCLLLRCRRYPVVVSCGCNIYYDIADWMCLLQQYFANLSLSLYLSVSIYLWIFSLTANSSGGWLRKW
jgi:hypothetical protein